MASAPPWAAVVSVIAGADQRGLKEQVGQPAQLVQWGRQLLVTLVRRLGGLGGDLPLDAAQGVLCGGALHLNSRKR
jgi:hypothetical protein